MIWYIKYQPAHLLLKAGIQLVSNWMDQFQVLNVSESENTLTYKFHDSYFSLNQTGLT